MTSQNTVKHSLLLELGTDMMSLAICLRISSLARSDDEHSSALLQKQSHSLDLVRAKMFSPANDPSAVKVVLCSRGCSNSCLANKTFQCLLSYLSLC